MDAYNCLLTAWLICATYGKVWKVHLQPKGHCATCRPQTTCCLAQIHMEVIRQAKELWNPLKSAALILPAELEKSEFPGV